MKDFKYKDIKGYEDKELFIQQDAFEMSPDSSQTGTRQLFNLSISENYILDRGERSYSPTFAFGTPYNYPTGFSNPQIINLDPQDDDGGIGLRSFAGNGVVVLDGQIQKNFTTPNSIVEYFKNKSIPNVCGTDDFQNPIDGSVINWEEDAIIKLDYHSPTALGYYFVDEVYSFRSGYFEFSIKTEKQNSVIAMGTTQFKNNFVTNSAKLGDTPFVEIPSGNSEPDQRLISYNPSDSFVQKYRPNSAKFSILIKNGKILLKHESIDSDLNFEIMSNNVVADGNWHHVVVNIAKPGTIRSHGYKFNKKYIDIWVDGQLDIRNDEVLSKKQIVFPTVDFLLGDIETVLKSSNYESWLSPDMSEKYSEAYDQNLAELYEDMVANGNGFLPGIGNDNSNLNAHYFSEKAKQSMFNGAIEFWVSGINMSLSKYEIQQRYRLFMRNEKQSVPPFLASCQIIQPVVTTNKKKALKLFWNNVIDNPVNGVELDKNWQVESFSVTHKTKNSPTETNNIDIANKKTLDYLSDIRVVFTENINIKGIAKFNRYQSASHIPHASVQKDPRNDDASLKLGFFLQTQEPFWKEDDFGQGSIKNLTYSGTTLYNNDRILLTNQVDPSENGIYVYNAPDRILERATDSDSPSKLNDSVVRVIDGYYKDTSWYLENNIESFDDYQKWIELEYHPNNENIFSQPLFGSRWSDEDGIERFIDLESDINVEKYDIIVFMNYPETTDQISNNFIGYDMLEIKQKYNNFLKSLQNVVANGANLMVTSPKLAEDLGIVRQYEQISQLTQASDAQSAAIDPFEVNGDPERYFDTHRNNKYQLVTPVTGLTDKQTYILTDFVNFVPENAYDYDEYHAKYSYRQFGLAEGNEFIIPGTALRAITNNKNIPGYRNNYRGSNNILAVNSNNVITGTIVTKLANTYYNGPTVTNNPYDDYATTIIVHNGQLLNGQPINGKIFVNCTEDSYTFSRKEYNKAVIQVVDPSDPYETIGTLNWQYSTKRLNRSPQRVNVSGLTELGQTTPTNGGGGAFIQAPSNSSSGVIRSETDFGKIDYQSDLYATESEEIYPIQEIPVLSMTWLGLKWLEG